MFGRYRAGDTFGEKEQTLYRRIPVFDTLTAARQTDDTATALLYEKIIIIKTGPSLLPKRAGSR